MQQTKTPKAKKARARWSWQHEERIPISEPRRLGLDKDQTTVFRWFKYGCKSRVTGELVKLEAVYVGTELCSSIARVNAFIARLNGLEAV